MKHLVVGKKGKSMNYCLFTRILLMICFLSSINLCNATDKMLLEDCLKELTIADVANRTAKYWTSRNELERLNRNKENEDYILSLFESSDVSEMGRTVVYKAILNSRKLTQDDLAFIVELFKAVYERIDWEEESLRSSRWFVTEEQALLELSMIIYTLQGIPNRTASDERDLLLKNPEVWLDMALSKSNQAEDDKEPEVEIHFEGKPSERNIDNKSEDSNFDNNSSNRSNMRPSGLWIFNSVVAFIVFLLAIVFLFSRVKNKDL